MPFYIVNLLVLAGAAAALQYRQWNNHDRKTAISLTDSEKPVSKHIESAGEAAFSQLKKRFLTVYVLAVAADWLQVIDLPGLRCRLNREGVIHLYSVQGHPVS